MEFKTIQELDVPEIGLGTFKLIGRQCEQTVRTALDLGYRHIDTAQMYKNEIEVGRAIESSRVNREELFITTKLWHTNLDHDDVLTTTEDSLRALDTEYVDLLLIHWPNKKHSLKETIEAMLILRDQGKVINIGVSNFPMDLLKQANEEVGAPVFCNQVEYHPFLGQFDLLDYAAEDDIMVTAYSPLAQGKVTENKLINDLAEKYGKTPAQIALRWLIEQEQVVAIPKASSKEHLQENMDVYDFQLEDDDFFAIDDLEKNTRLINPDFAPQWD